LLWKFSSTLHYRFNQRVPSAVFNFRQELNFIGYSSLHLYALGIFRFHILQKRELLFSLAGNRYRSLNSLAASVDQAKLQLNNRTKVYRLFGVRIRLDDIRRDRLRD